MLSSAEHEKNFINLRPDHHFNHLNIATVNIAPVKKDRNITLMSLTDCTPRTWQSNMINREIQAPVKQPNRSLDKL